MEYFVVGPDGKEYGPATVDTLRSWVAENRILPGTMLKNFQSGQTVLAGTIPALFPSTPPVQAAPPPGSVPPGDWSRPPTMAAAYPRGGNSGYVDTGKGDVIYAIVIAVIALLLFFVAHGIGLIIGVGGLVRAIRAREKGHALANVAIAISVITLVAIGIGWFLRLSGSPT